MFCKNCGKEIDDLAVMCVHCGTMLEDKKEEVKPIAEDKVSVGFCILSFLVPIFGIIYWALKYKETPKKAKACGITAIFGWVLSAVANVGVMILLTYLETNFHF